MGKELPTSTSCGGAGPGRMLLFEQEDLFVSWGDRDM